MILVVKAAKHYTISAFKTHKVVLSYHRAAALMSQNHMTNYFHKAKEHGVQWQLNRSYRLTCTSSCIAAQFNRHGNCATATVNTVVLCKFQAACISKIIVELTTFLLCDLMSKMKCIGECCGGFTGL